MKKIIVILAIGILSSCNYNKSNINYLDVHYVEEGITSQVPYDCSMLIGKWNPDILFHTEITDQDFLNEFEALYERYEFSNEGNAYDIRIKILIHKNNKIVDTLCMGENFDTFLNSKRVKDSPELLKLLKEKLEYSKVPK